MEISKAVGALGALPQETRLRIFRALVQSGPDGLPAGSIASKLDLPGPTLSFHLAQLKQAGLVSCRRDGRSLIYQRASRAVPPGTTPQRFAESRFIRELVSSGFVDALYKSR